MTHPFHPLLGREFTLVTYRHNWGEDRAYYHDDAGKLCSVPAGWTSLCAPDAFVVVARGRCPFRLADLVELCRMVRAISHADGASSVQEDQSNV